MQPLPIYKHDPVPLGLCQTSKTFQTSGLAQPVRIRKPGTLGESESLLIGTTDFNPRCQPNGNRMWRFQGASPQPSWFIVTVFMVGHDAYSMWGPVCGGVCPPAPPPHHIGCRGPHQNALGTGLQMPPVSPIPFDNVHIQLGPKVLVLVSWDKGWRK